MYWRINTRSCKDTGLKNRHNFYGLCNSLELNLEALIPMEGHRAGELQKKPGRPFHHSRDQKSFDWGI